MSKIYPAIKDRITEYTEILKMDKEEIRNYFSTCMKKYSLPFHLFTSEECTDIVICEIEDNVPKLEMIYDNAGKRFYKKYKKYLRDND